MNRCACPGLSQSCRPDGGRWPDPNPEAGMPPMVDDVARMNAQRVERIFRVRTVDDVKAVLRLARQHGRPVSMRGTRHSMGGHTIAADGYVIDLMLLNRWSFDLATETVTTEPGATWADLIVGLNEWGYSPRTMQSYSTFSVGGSLAVNAHGITTDHCMAEAVVRFKLIRWDGSEIECSREAEGEARELFGLVLGGYGLFGVIGEVTLRTRANVKLSMEMLALSVADFPAVYEAALADEDDDIDTKMARLDVTNLENIDLFLFRRDQKPGTRTISTLAAEPHCMPLKQQILYKWIMPQLKEARYAMERAAGKAIDIEASSERNMLMYESAEPLARLYNPLFAMDDTFVLQEYFVPAGAFIAWIDAAKPAYALAASLDKIELLNTTVRFVRKDDDTVLAYARANEGSYAFVLYYRVHRNAAADGQLEQVHQMLAQASMSLGGSFYLPYRHHYSDAQLEAAYPTAAHFFRKKQQYDPHGLFRSTWYERYGQRFWVVGADDPSVGGADSSASPPPSPAAASAVASISLASTLARTHPTPPSSDTAAPASSRTRQHATRRPSPPPLAEALQAASSVPWVSERRSDSYRRLLRDSKLRRQFRQQFLVRIFNVEDPGKLFNALARVARDPRNADDVQCFEDLQKLLTDQSDAMSTARRAWKQVRQLRLQKNELRRETASLLSQLGRLGTLTGYVSIGDHGKMVLEYQRALDLRGKVWVVHDVDADARHPRMASSAQEEPPSASVPEVPAVSHIPSHNGSAGVVPELSAILERGSVDPVGEHVLIDYEQIEPLRAIPDGACDLVTMHQGLHHLPQSKLVAFLREVHRILRPSGLFLVREHDASPELIPMLDLAHSIFNVLTGVSTSDERTEIRAFRPILAWRSLIESIGFDDCMVYEVEKGDPTIDEMMCFVKPATSPSPPPPLPLHADTPSPPPSAVPAQIAMLLDSAPPALLDFLRVSLRTLSQALPQLEQFILGRIDGTDNRLLTAERVTSFFEPVKIVIERFGPVLEHVQPLQGLFSLLPLEEAFLLVQSLLRKAESGEGTPAERAAIQAIHFVQAAMGMEGAAADASAPRPTPSVGDMESGTPRRVELDAEATASDESAPALDSEHVENLLRRLLAARPELSQPRALERAGFPPRAISVLYAQVDGVGVAAVSRTLALKLDARAFDELSAAVELLLAVDAPPLSYNRPGGLQQAGSPWRRAAMAILGAPGVTFSSSAQTMASFVGMGPLIDMWREAQRRDPAAAVASALRVDATPMPPSVSAQIGAAYDGLDMQRFEVSVRLDEGSATPAIPSVKVIHQAVLREVRPSGILHSECVCTAEASRRLLEEDASAAGGGFTLHLRGARVDSLLRDVNMIPRRPSAPERGYKFGDLTKRTLRVMDGMIEQVLESGTRRVLYLQFSRCAEQGEEVVPDEYLPRVAALVSRLDAHRLLGGLHRDDGEYTWFKLNEWMQVEIMEAFGASLSHAAWYRFPLMEMLTMYASTFAKTATIVQNKFGFRKAWLSAAAMYDIVPGAIMAFYFSQLWVLGMPLRSLWGSGTSAEDYERENTGDKAPIEELLVRTGLRPPDWAGLNAQIKGVRQLLPELYVLTVPTFKPLTAALLKLAQVPEIEVLRISNQEQLQVRVQFRRDAQLDALRGKHGVQVMFQYTFPVDGTGKAPPTTASLCVEAPYLLSTIRFCSRHDIDVMQVYDFWN